MLSREDSLSFAIIRHRFAGIEPATYYYYPDILGEGGGGSGRNFVLCNWCCGRDTTQSQQEEKQVNLTIVATYFITGLVVEYLTGINESVVKKGVKLGQIATGSFFFGFITPVEFNEIAMFYIVTPAVLSLTGVRIGDVLDQYAARVIGRMFLNGKGKEITPWSFWEFVIQERRGGEWKREKSKRSGKSDARVSG